jgi:hypothetical protein
MCLYQDKSTKKVARLKLSRVSSNKSVAEQFCNQMMKEEQNSVMVRQMAYKMPLEAKKWV